MMSDELTESLGENVSIKRLQKFSINNSLYKISLLESKAEVKISFDSSDISYYQIESKINVTDQFENQLEKAMNSAKNNNNINQFFSKVAS